ncbi:FkbM family methyltransferase [Mongoliitalea lutea]|uniref:Methyltransferase FkbM domain-containing protein n=1 Tax=Mongoliitalea lutea TaxID=849756 RepID=A0A8J3G5L7_9BACT|nr:FkbM family methyltransferase [Mongoliitalea lutea]GHB37238.1 hypothetical protein GCM10008106_18170 [Mongoliitalea lutea]
MLIVTQENSDTFQVKSHLKWISLKSRFRFGRKLFIDCGTNLGQGFEYFQKYFPLKDFDAVLIEPNPNCIKIIENKYGDNKKIEIIQKAAWINNSTLKFFGLVEDERGETSQGASVLEEHNGSMYKANKEASLEVEGFSFGDFLDKKSKEYEVIIVKLDIESAEYAVLDDIIKSGSIKNIDHIFVEFHSQYFDVNDRPKYLEKERLLIEKMKKMNVGVSIWI